MMKSFKEFLIEGFWPSIKTHRLIKAMQKQGWELHHQTGSHRIFRKEGHEPYALANADHEELGPKIVSRIAKVIGLKPEHLR